MMRRILNWWAARRIFGREHSGFIVCDKIGSRVVESFDLRDTLVLSNENEGARRFIPRMRFFVGPAAVNTIGRTPEEVFNRVAGEPRVLTMIQYLPGVDVSAEIEQIVKGGPVVEYNSILKAVSGGYRPSMKRLYVRIEEDMIRAVLENGMDPFVVRFNGTVHARRRFIRLAKEFQHVKVRVVVVKKTPSRELSKYERKVFDAWTIPRRSEGIDIIEFLEWC